MKTITKKLLSAFLVIAVSVSYLLSYNVITTAPNADQSLNYKSARYTRTAAKDANGNYVFNIQINIPSGEWGITRTIEGQQRKVDEQYVSDIISNLNKVYETNGVNVRFNVNDIYVIPGNTGMNARMPGDIVGTSDANFNYARDTAYVGPNDVVIYLNPLVPNEPYIREYYSNDYIYLEMAEQYNETKNVNVLSHELGHFRGMQDLYFNTVVQNNVNNQTRTTSYSGGLMTYNNTSPMSWNSYERYILNNNAGKVTVQINPKMITDMPAKNSIKVVDANGNPLTGAEVTVYNSYLNAGYSGSVISNSPSLAATNTNADGTVNLTLLANPGEWNKGLAGTNNPPFKTQLVSVKKDGITKYFWIEAEDYNKAYWLGNKDSHTWKLDFAKGEVVNPRIEKIAEGDAAYYNAISAQNSGNYQDAFNKYLKAAEIYKGLNVLNEEKADYSSKINAANLGLSGSISKSEGMLIKGSDNAIYVIQNGKKMHIPDMATFYAKGYNMANVKTLEDAVVNSVTSGGSLASVSGSTGGSGSGTGSKVVVNTSLLNVRSGAGTTYGKVGTVSIGQSLEIISQSNGWYQVKYSGGTGWVSGSYVSISNSVPITGKTGVVSTYALNVRSGAGTNYGKIGSVSSGQTVSILGSQNGWYKISYGGSTGWVSGQYVRLNTSPSTPSSVGLMPAAANEIQIPIVKIKPKDMQKQEKFQEIKSDDDNTAVKKPKAGIGDLIEKISDTIDKSGKE